MVDNASYIVIPEPHMALPYNTEVEGWLAYFNRSRETYFQIWRPVKNNSFMLVGESQLTPFEGEVGETELLLSDEEKFNVSARDVIGLYFPSSGSVPFTHYHDNCINEKELRYLRNPAGHFPGTVVNFEAQGCRRYSFQVILKYSKYYTQTYMYVYTLFHQLCAIAQLHERIFRRITTILTYIRPVPLAM